MKFMSKPKNHLKIRNLNSFSTKALKTKTEIYSIYEDENFPFLQACVVPDWKVCSAWHEKSSVHV